MPSKRLMLLVGSYAQARYLRGGRKSPMTANVRAQPDAGAGVLALPHPSWRSGIWMKRNPWFERETLPPLRAEIRKVLESSP